MDKSLAVAISRTLNDPLTGHPITLGEAHILSRQPYVNERGESVILVNTGQLDPQSGLFVYREKRLHINATLRKDEWVRVDDAVREAARERLVVIEDMRAAGLVQNVGGLGVLISEWEAASEMTDAEVTMDGESKADMDRQEFNINGVPIPIIQKPFKIGERVLMASRTRGASLDVTTSQEAGRSVARTAEGIVINGSTLGAVKSAANTYQIYGLTTFPNRGLATISDWSDASTSPETILGEILAMIQIAETQHRHFGPFNLYIPGDAAFQFRKDLKAFSDKTLMERVLAIDAVRAVRVSDVLASGNALLVQMTSDVLDLAMGADLNTIQWASPSGWTNFFQSFMALAPRFKNDYDNRTGIVHATVGT